ncbi:hypothetical protein [Streptomyces zagrosensis]|uniref:Uncharacterized protein n=1 Tax=Streptomyces zagrosensis TaxID=1042984 RepID=A0A7W9Q6K8_9ACTN|nr:hypothetical protein [Streptomyces zagrosensis]MBB5934598.1 hypothetical protein [Streptomyces zagrosensis]
MTGRQLIRQVVDVRLARAGDCITLGELVRTIQKVRRTETGTTLVLRDGSVTLLHGVRITVQRGGSWP